MMQYDDYSLKDWYIGFNSTWQK